MGTLWNTAAVFATQDWEAAGHADSFGWLHALGTAGAWLLLALFGILILRAILRSKRYRALGVLDEERRQQLTAEVADAEKRTVGEIVPVVLERSDAHPQADWLAGLTSLILGTALASGVLPWDHPLWLLACQAGLLALGFVLARLLPDFKRLFVTERRATEMAQEQALQEFFRLNLHDTEARTGVLLFVSLFEHRVIVLGDEGIDALVDAEHWARTDDAILEGIRSGDLARGLTAGLRQCADVLAEHFPWTEGDRNELPDRVIVRRE